MSETVKKYFSNMAGQRARKVEALQRENADLRKRLEWANTVAKESMDIEKATLQEWDEESADLRRRLEEANETIYAFGFPYAVRWALEHKLPEGYMHPDHYEALKKAGARLAYFKPYRPTLERNK